MHSTFTHADNGGRTLLYRNLGDGRFEDVAAASGLLFRGWTLAAGAADLDNDGWPDLYLANDFGPDELYFNTGATESPPRFRRVVDTAGHPGIGDDWWKGMNVDFGDVDANGYLDIYVTNILARRYKTDEGNMLWLNVTDPGAADRRRFWNAAQAGGAEDGGWGWGAKFLDANNDGLLDIAALNGFVTGDREHTYWYELQEMVTQTKNNAADTADWPAMENRDLSGYEPTRFFVQRAAEGDGPPRFAEAAAAAGLGDDLNGRGVAVNDFDNDGALDLFIANQGAASLITVDCRPEHPTGTARVVARRPARSGRNDERAPPRFDRERRRRARRGRRRWPLAGTRSERRYRLRVAERVPPACRPGCGRAGAAARAVAQWARARFHRRGTRGVRRSLRASRGGRHARARSHERSGAMNATAPVTTAVRRAPRRTRRLILAAAVVMAILVALAVWRGGLLDLPAARAT
jgi:hypothetical protein